MLPVAFRPFAGKAEDLSRAAAKAFFRLGLDENAEGTAEVRVSGPNEKDGGMWTVGLTDAVGRPAWVGFAFNRQRGEAALSLDGHWRNRYVLEKPVALPDFGLAVAAATQRRPAPRSVLVSPINEDLSRPVPPADQDAVGLVNGDQIVGRLESIGTNEVAFPTTGIGRMVLPLEQVGQVNFPRMPRSQAGDCLPQECINLIDGDPDTCWSSRTQPQSDLEPVWIRLDLPVEHEVSRIVLHKRPVSVPAGARRGRAAGWRTCAWPT